MSLIVQLINRAQSLLEWDTTIRRVEVEGVNLDVPEGLHGRLKRGSDFFRGEVARCEREDSEASDQSE